MRRSNPVVIPRNHRIEQAIQQGYQGRFDLFHRLVEAWRAPYQEDPDWAELELPPREEEIVGQTFCGT
jgi:uncharacterized protein YdiU (UPF0061 family)